MRLFLVRHAVAEASDPARWPQDRLRPLTKQGRKEFRRMARKLVKCGVLPSWIATSPYKRAQETAKIWAKVVSKKLPEKCPVVPADALAPDGDLAKMIEFTKSQAGGASQIAWVGHSPDLEMFLARLVGAPQGRLHLAKGGIACVDFEEEIAEGAGELRWLVAPDLVGA
ncbi:MAG: phosphohistidine phosphatase SixA [Thermoguttaceae bacterium]|nr:phosphohistidine phosphatase SixA [Thermoguttaceae bacterium]MDW8077873.1 phosphohistidine phosphatase SixA [Thermoguttaceae bacterium]